jgi:beta-1,4-mannosyltransferase
VVLRYRSVGQTGHSMLADVVAAARQFSERPEGLPISPIRSAGDEPLLLAYWPIARTNNFQSLLYCRGWEHGVAPLPVADFEQMAALPWAGPAACHFHWLATIEDEAAIDRFEAVLGTIKAQQRKIIWTVHNVLPHDAGDIAAALRVRRAIAAAADVVHVMNETTAAEVEPHFSLAGKRVFHTPHPSYVGDLPDFTRRREARFQLGLRPETTVFPCFGAIQPYKGIEELIAAAGALSRDRPELDWALVIAGVAKDEALVQRLRSAGDLDGRIQLHPHKVPTEDVQYFFRAADYAVCAYRTSLNSGAAMLALSFGVPVVAPHAVAFDEYLARGAGIGYHPTTGALAAALAAAAETDRSEMRTRALEFAVERRPEAASHAFFEGLMQIL